MRGMPIEQADATATEVKVPIPKFTNYGYCIVHMDLEGSQLTTAARLPDGTDTFPPPVLSSPSLLPGRRTLSGRQWRQRSS